MYECAYIESPLVPDCPYFASKVQLGPNGVEDIFEIGEVTDFEQEGIEKLIPELKASIAKGIDFANK